MRRDSIGRGRQEQEGKYRGEGTASRRSRGCFDSMHWYVPRPLCRGIERFARFGSAEKLLPQQVQQRGSCPQVREKEANGKTSFRSRGWIAQWFRRCRGKSEI